MLAPRRVPVVLPFAIALAVAVATGIPNRLAAQALPTPAEASEVDALAAHYARVEAELRRADVDHLDPATRAARARAIEHLREYRLARVFGVNTDHPDLRMPYFVDREQRRCAVAHLLDRSGGEALTARVARTANHAFVVDLATDSDLRTWLARNGLTVEEAARIQAPPRYPFEGRRPPFDPDARPAPPPPPRQVELPGTWTPGDAVGRTWSDVQESRSRDDRGTRPTPASAAATTPDTRTATARRTGLQLTDLPPETWQEWWTWNRASYLEEVFAKRPARIVAMADDRLDWLAGSTAAERDAARATVRRALDDTNAEVRAAACVALGRLASPDDVAALIARIDDPAFAVRNEAILALGTTGHATAVHALLRIAANGHVAPSAPSAPNASSAPGASRHTAPPVGMFARSLAIVALGLAKRAGATAVDDALVRTLCTVDHGRAENERLRVAAQLYARVTGSAAFADLDLATATDPAIDRDVRARAIDGLTFTAAAPRRVLLEALAGRDVTLRRSAAIALGASRDPLALPSLMTAFELENEMFTRATLLLAMGRHGGTRARDFLVEQLQNGKRPLRAYAALGIAIWNRDRGESDLHRLVREAHAQDVNRDHSGAYLLAMGIGKDAGAVDLLLETLTNAADPWTRGSAAEALALLDDDRAKSALRASVDSDACPYVRGVASEILAWLGDPGDTMRIVRSLREAQTPIERSRLAGALGRVGGASARRELRTLLEAATTDPRTRTAALTAFGIASAADGTPRLAPTGRDANFTVFPDWMRVLLSSNL